MCDHMSGKPEDNLTVIPQEPSIFIIETGSLTVLELAKEARLARKPPGSAFVCLPSVVVTSVCRYA